MGSPRKVSDKRADVKKAVKKPAVTVKEAGKSK